MHINSKRDTTAKTAAVAAIAGALVTYIIMRRQNKQQQETEDEEKSKKRQPSVHFLTSESESSHHNLTHKLNPVLQQAALAPHPRKAQAYFRDQPNATHVIRIALTGGPCAGKSSALSEVRQCATAQGFDVYCAPEVATLFLNSGVAFPQNQEQQFLFQKSICVLQLALERTMTRIVQSTGRPSIIIFDRGLMDTKGYLRDQPELWQRILRELSTSGAADGSGEDQPLLFTVGVTEDYCLKRYDGVVHLVTAAEGAEEFYKQGHVTDDSGRAVIRNETIDQALALDYAMREAWRAHSHHHILGNTGTFQDKLEATVNVILKLAEETHPSESLKARKSIFIK